MTPISLPRSKSAQGIAYYRCGQGHPIVLVHGVGLRAESWCQQIDVLARRHSVYAVDMPGHGSSEAFIGDAPGLDQYVAKIAEFIFAEIAQPVIIIGHSMGAMIALRYAQQHAVMCRGVAALNAVYQRNPAASRAVQQRAASMRKQIDRKMLAAPVQRWFGENPQGKDKLMAELCSLWLANAEPRGYAAAYSVFADEPGATEFALRQLQMPALFLTGDGDLNSTPEMSRTMASLAPKGQSVILQNARHMLPLTHPRQTNQVLGQFVRQADCSDLQNECFL